MNKDIETYLAAVPRQRSDRLEILHGIITNLFPHAVVDMEYRMPTYHVVDGWVAIANQKNYISLYTCGYHHIEAFKAQHPQIKTGKGCINFKDSDELPTEDIETVVRHAIMHPKGN